MRKSIICFCEAISNENIALLELLSKKEVQVHLFNDVKRDEMEKINIEQIINSLNIQKKDQIMIFSDNLNFLRKLWNEKSWDFDSFIYLGEMDIKKEIEIENKMNLFSKEDFELYLFKRESFIEKYIEYYTIFFKSIKDNDLFRSYFKKIYMNSKKIIEIVKKSNNLNKKKCRLELLIEDASEIKKIYGYSILIEIYKEARYLEEILTLIKNSKYLTKENKFFLIYQMIRISFNENKIESSISNNLTKDIYFEILNDFKESLNIKKDRKIKKRDENLIIIFTNQFLNLNHAPTKTVLDRAYTLIKKMNKKVIIINTRELLTMKGYVPLYSSVMGNINKEYKNLSSYKYKEIDIPFYQSEFQMPDENEVLQIVNIVKKYKPNLIFTVGGMNITADICSTLVPVATISTVFSSIALADSDFYIIGRKIQKKDLNYMKLLGKEQDALIESKFTFDFKEQKKIFTRSNLNFPVDKFIVALVGGRLQKECDDEFLEHMNELAKKDFFFISIGELLIEKKKYPSLFNNFKNLGFQDDVLSILENVDIYINPKRKGGGSSAAEALYKKKPVITLNYGDVATAVGGDFIVDNYEQMKNVAIEYMQNSQYYEEKSIVAKDVARDLLDTDKHFKEVYRRILTSNKFY